MENCDPLPRRHSSTTSQSRTTTAAFGLPPSWGLTNRLLLNLAGRRVQLLTARSVENAQRRELARREKECGTKRERLGEGERDKVRESWERDGVLCQRTCQKKWRGREKVSSEGDERERGFLSLLLYLSSVNIFFFGIKSLFYPSLKELKSLLILIFFFRVKSHFYPLLKRLKSPFCPY